MLSRPLLLFFILDRVWFSWSCLIYDHSFPPLKIIGIFFARIFSVGQSSCDRFFIAWLKQIWNEGLSKVQRIRRGKIYSFRHWCHKLGDGGFVCWNLVVHFTFCLYLLSSVYFTWIHSECSLWLNHENCLLSHSVTTLGYPLLPPPKIGWIIIKSNAAIINSKSFAPISTLTNYLSTFPLPLQVF